VQTIRDKENIITLEAHEAIEILKEKFIEIVYLNYFIEDLLARLEIDTLGRGLYRVLT
jgi:hypothetical protein